MEDERELLEAAPPGRGRRVLAAAALAASAALAVTLSVRQIASHDLGYHLAYGDYFLDHGRIVQTNRFVWAEMRDDILSDPRQLGPGCTYDPATKTYHFINANWLSQVVMAAVHRHLGGITGIWAMQILTIAAIFGVLIATLLAHRVGVHWIAAGVLLAAMTAYERFDLRPEVLGYLVLVGQLALLLRERLGPKTVAALFVLQVLAANFHSYFLLGIALTGAVLADALIHWVWSAAVVRKPQADQARRLKWAAVALAAMMAAPLVNPWFLRGAIMPIQTLSFLSEHHIGAPDLGIGGVHPWATIGEFAAPFERDYLATFTTYGYVAVLALAVVSALAALARGRFGWALIIAGMTVVSLSMRRNIAPATLILMPVCLLSLMDFGRWVAGLMRRRARRAHPAGGNGRKDEPAPARWARAGRIVAVSVSVAVILLSAWWTVQVVTQRFYFSDRNSWRFGRGLSAAILPVRGTEWVRSHGPAGRVFCDYDTSSAVLYFGRPVVQEVPVLTNTWAYPPYVMQWVFQCVDNRRDFQRVADAHDVGFVIMRPGIVTGPLIKAMAAGDEWALVSVSIGEVTFVRRNGPNAELAARCAITRDNIDLEAYVRQARRDDPLPAFALHCAAIVMYQLGWCEHAITIRRELSRLGLDYHEATTNMALLLAMRGTVHMMRMQDAFDAGQVDRAERLRRAGLADWTEAKDLVDGVLRKHDYKPARKIADLLDKQTNEFARRAILRPKGSENWKEMFPPDKLPSSH